MLLLTWSSPVSVVVVTRLLGSRVGEPWDECLCFEQVVIVCLVMHAVLACLCNCLVDSGDWSFSFSV